MAILEVFSRTGVSFPQPEMALDITAVAEAVHERLGQRVNKEELPVPTGGQCPRDTMLYEYPSPEDPRVTRVLFATQERREDGFVLTVSALDVHAWEEERLRTTFYGCGHLRLATDGRLRSFGLFEREGRPHAVPLEPTEFLELAYPLLVTNHLMHARGIGVEDLEAGRDAREQPAWVGLTA